jgi:hypothetical protein
MLQKLLIYKLNIKGNKHVRENTGNFGIGERLTVENIKGPWTLKLELRRIELNMTNYRDKIENERQ